MNFLGSKSNRYSTTFFELDSQINQENIKLIIRNRVITNLKSFEKFNI